jgi:ABC-2 type transport system ATP-binding protein
MNAIEFKDLCKNYGSRQALKNITLTIPQGTIFGLLGPNGAGKTTLIKALVGALKPTSGTVIVLEHDPLSERRSLRKKIGYMPQAPALYEDLSAQENIHFFGKLQNVEHLERKIAEILAFTELKDRAHDQVHTFSGGMKKRVSLACALIHRPTIVFLDEPTAAVDPHLKVKTWHLFRNLAQQGVTLFISTHLMDEALLCDRLAIISKGSLLAVDTPEALLRRGQIQLNMKTDNGIIAKNIPGSPESLAQILQEFGLTTSIQALTVTSDSLEKIILDLIAGKNHE